MHKWQTAKQERRRGRAGRLGQFVCGAYGCRHESGIGQLSTEKSLAPTAPTASRL